MLIFGKIQNAMKSKYLLPHVYKKIGWIISIPALIIGIFHLHFAERLDAYRGFPWLEPVMNTVTGVILIVGLLLIAFSREKTEDEYINKIRLESFQVAVLINYILLIICMLFLYGLDFLSIMVYNMYTVLLIFIARFNYLIYRNKNAV